MSDDDDQWTQRIADATRLHIFDQPIGKSLQPVSMDELCCLHRLPLIHRGASLQPAVLRA